MDGFDPCVYLRICARAYRKFTQQPSNPSNASSPGAGLKRQGWPSLAAGPRLGDGLSAGDVRTTYSGSLRKPAPEAEVVRPWSRLVPS